MGSMRKQPRELLDEFEIELPQCRRCDGLSLRIYHTEAGGDGSVTRWMLCLKCRYRFKFIFLPYRGTGTFDPG